jgi:hypothetical protein
MFPHLTTTDRLISERIAELAEDVPLTNTTGIRHALSQPIPGKIGGDCAHQALEVARVLGDIPGEIRFHRSIGALDPSGAGKAGAHVAAFKVTEDGLRLIDLSLLHADPIAVPSDGFVRSLMGPSVAHMAVIQKRGAERFHIETLPIQGVAIGAPHDFFIDPEAAVPVRRSDTAYAEVRQGGSFRDNIYFGRFFRDGAFCQVTWHRMSGRLTWDRFFFVGDEGRHTREKLSDPHATALRIQADDYLKCWDLDLGVLVPFLKDTPYLQEEG